jgi:pyrroline-5-carboxylate reductase
MQTVGFIGCGNMGSAIIYGISRAKEFHVAGYDHNPEKLQKLENECGLLPCSGEEELVKKSDIVVIAVKPYTVEELLLRIKEFLTSDTIIVSIAAGVSIAAIKKICPFCPVSVIMPNTPAMVGEGCTALCFDDGMLQDVHKETIKKIFACVGTTCILPEAQFAEFSTLIGSGPAFVFYMLEAMLEGAIRLGFKYDDAKKMLEQLFLGSTELARQNSGIPYAKLRLNVCSPKGTTIAGMNSLDKNAVRGAVIEAIMATFDRNLELKK